MAATNWWAADKRAGRDAAALPRPDGRCRQSQRSPPRSPPRSSRRARDRMFEHGRHRRRLPRREPDLRAATRSASRRSAPIEPLTRDRAGRRRPARNLGADPGAGPRPRRRGPGGRLRRGRRSRSIRCWSAAAMAASSRWTRSSRRRSSPCALRRPVQLTWPRIQEMRARQLPARRRGAADRPGWRRAGSLGWQARIAAPATAARSRRPARRDGAWLVRPDAAAVGGARAALRHSPMSRSTMSRPISASRTGSWRGERAQLHRLLHRKLHRRAGARRRASSRSPSASACSAATPRLARCLTTATSIGGWDGGGAGQRHGHRLPSPPSARYIATLVEVEIDRRSAAARAARGLRRSIAGG